jgi:hypothetical protein
MLLAETATTAPAGASPDTEAVLREAIARRRLVLAAYNRGTSLLAPHSLFTRHGELYLRAVTVERDGRKPREAKLGTFKLSGLTGPEVTRRLFSAAAVFAGLEGVEGAAPAAA